MMFYIPDQYKVNKFTFVNYMTYQVTWQISLVHMALVICPLCAAATQDDPMSKTTHSEFHAELMGLAE